MEHNIEEAIRAKENAEKLFSIQDYAGAKRSAIKAQAFCPQLKGITHMVATFEIYAASLTKIHNEIDLYSILGLNPNSKKSLIRKQYKKLAILLHPDKNKTIGADVAFKLVSEAWCILSDNNKRKSYDLLRNKNFLNIVTHSSNVVSKVRIDTFWTVCTSCRVQYEYLRKYVNKRLSCKNCRGVFVAVETGGAPVTYCPWAYTENGLTNHSYNLGPYGLTGFQPGRGSEFGGNVSFQWNTSAISDPNGFVYNSVDKTNGKHHESVKIGRRRTKRRIEIGNGEIGSISITESDINTLTQPTFDSRKMLIDKARSVIRVKLEEMKSASKLEKKGKLTKKTIIVHDPDFHDFDTDRSEEVFKPKQIWAIYDEEDGMPRLYCLIRQVLSVKPFKVYISYLNSKTDTEFGCVKWIESGFTKSCGSFRVFHSDIVDRVNIFSHVLGREKAGRGGCVRIYPRPGEVWAVYRNWSESWDRKTEKDVIWKYEMVEVLEEYCEESGVCVGLLVRLEGYRSVYRRKVDENSVWWISKREMMRFSHRVPSCLLEGRGLDLPEGCWDLDPAAMPEEVL